MLQSGGLPTGTTPLRLLRHLAGLYADPAPVDGLPTGSASTGSRGRRWRRLSGGQHQRLALAAALVGLREVVFLDEPTAGLDPHGRLDVYDLVDEIRSGGTTVVVTTHSFEEAERLADHLVIVSDGRTVAEGLTRGGRRVGHARAGLLRPHPEGRRASSTGRHIGPGARPGAVRGGHAAAQRRAAPRSPCPAPRRLGRAGLHQRPLSSARARGSTSRPRASSRCASCRRRSPRRPSRPASSGGRPCSASSGPLPSAAVGS